MPAPRSCDREIVGLALPAMAALMVVRLVATVARLAGGRWAASAA